MKKLSIILPIYNVEAFLDDCFASLYCQDMAEEDYEIICVIDGSPDNSKSVIEGYMEKHSNIVMIEQENKGVSAARNNGLKHASGKYVWFVDPDDMVAANCFSKIYSIMEEKKADVFEFEYVTCEEDEHYQGREVLFEADGADRGGASASGCLSVCLSAYLLQNGLTFREGMAYGEDYLWMVQLKYRKHINCYTNAALYIYRQREGSAMHAVDPRKTKKHHDDMLELADVYAEELERCKREGLPQKVLTELERRSELCIEAALWYNFRAATGFKAAREELAMLKKKDVYPYKLMMWKMFGENKVNSFAYRLFTFLFPFEPYYLLLCSLGGLKKRLRKGK